jgi:outer membrane receptor protein involved in Fe transport
MSNLKEKTLSNTRKSILSFVAATAIFFGSVGSMPASAQETAAGASGSVVDSSGVVTVGAVVELIHVPSNTVSKATTDANGRFAVRGLRVGGPYTVNVYVGGNKVAGLTDQYLRLGDTGNLNLIAELLAEVVVSAGRLDEIFDAARTGTGSTVTSERLAALPSISRNIQDYVRTDPRIAQTDKERGEISAGGQNTRFNNIRIDGVSTNDAFGLESNNLPTDRQPIPLDAIESINIALTNFDVSRSGFTGASIDAVTKSGTNEYKGSAYYITREADWVGKRDGRKFTGFKKEETLGATFGGPIIQDKLFFFGSYEKFERAALAPTFGPVGSGANQIVTGITTAQIQEVQNIAKNVWGFDAGSFDPPSALNTEIEDVMVKFDYNINDSHRASLRLNRTEQSDPFLRNIGARELSLSGYWHVNNKKFESAVAHLYSDWTPNLSTEFSASVANQSSLWDIGDPRPAIRICLNSNSCSGADSIWIGSERFRHVNILETETVNVFGAATYVMGDHAIKFGAEYESRDIFNLFGRDQYGYYEFYGINNFRNGTPAVYNLFYPTNGGVETRAAAWTLENAAVFLQDTWTVNPELTVTAGVRVDMPIVGDKPAYNALASNFFGLRNDSTVDGNYLVQPRVSFNWRPEMFDRKTQVRGGVGLFQGIAANVWLSNPFSNNNVIQSAIFVNNATAAGIRFSADPNNQPGVRPPPGLGGNVDFVSPDLQLPSAWKASFAVDHELPWYGLVASVETVLTEVEEGIWYVKPNLGRATGTAPDGRPYYWSTVTPGQFTGAASQNTSLRNRDFGVDSTIANPTSKGNGKQLTVSLQGPQNPNWYWNVGYTYTEATEVNTLTSSQAASNWNNAVRVDPNANIAEKSVYAIKDRFTATLSYRKPLVADLVSSVGVFYEGRVGKPFTYTFVNDMNGDGRVNDPLFVPNKGDVTFTGGAAMENAFFSFLENNKQLAKYQGGIAAVNGSNAPWVHNVDLRFSQELPVYGGFKGEVWVDVMNVGNMINKDWGRIEEVGFPGANGVVRFAGIQNGKYVYDFRGSDVRDLVLRDNRAESRWAVQLGVKFKF